MRRIGVRLGSALTRRALARRVFTPRALPPRALTRRRLGGTAVAVAAMAALTASQAPGLAGVAAEPPKDDALPAGQPEWAGPPPDDDSYHTELPPLVSPAPLTRPGGPSLGTVAEQAVWDQSGIPATVFAAYQNAERSIARTDPGCRLPWELLAAIGKVESGHAGGGRVDAHGTTRTPILGPVLDGVSFALISDTDNGAYDGNTVYDRAVGPMQFIPSTWAGWAADGNGDGLTNPSNIHDAALAAGHYLCAGDRNLAVKADLDRAVLSYNHSRTYLNTVLSWLEFYRNGTHAVPDGSGPVPSTPGAGGTTPALRPVGGRGPSSNGNGNGTSPRPGDDGIVVGPQPSPSTSPQPTPSESGPASPTPTPTDTPTESPDPSPSTSEPEPTPSETEPSPTDPGPSPSEPEPTPTPTEPDPTCTTPAPDPSATETPSPDPTVTPGETCPAPTTA